MSESSHDPADRAGGEVRFAARLFRGTAACYDRYRLPNPGAMPAGLLRRAQVPERGSLPDLACGTGQLAFPLRRRFPRCGPWTRNRTWCT